MKWFINIPDDEFFANGVCVYYSLNKNGLKQLRVQPMGESATWDRIGLLRSGVVYEEAKLAKAFRGA